MADERKPGHCPYGGFRRGEDGRCCCYGCLDDLKEGLDCPRVIARRHRACNRTCIRAMQVTPPPLTQTLGSYMPALDTEEIAS